MENGRLIIDPPAGGAWNMAVDQAILETADRTGLVTLRFYQWSEPTLSLGYFQSHKDRNKHPPSMACDMVRRKTGGGAILHHHELTYSLCVPSSNRWSKRNSDLYQIVHQHIIDLLNVDNAGAYLFSDEPGENSEPANKDQGDSSRKPPHATGVDSREFSDSPVVDQQAFMCFQRRSSGDICLNGFKIVGSAQRRLKNSLLQHGSVLLERSPFSEMLPGIKDLANYGGNVDDLINQLGNSLEGSLQMSLKNEKLNSVEIGVAEGLAKATFGSQEWNQSR